DAVDALQCTGDGGRVADVAAVDFHLVQNPIAMAGVAMHLVDKGVEHADGIAVTEQRPCHMTTDEPRTSSNQNQLCHYASFRDWSSALPEFKYPPTGSCGAAGGR